MAQNFNLGGAGEAIERTKNAAEDMGEEAKGTLSRVTDSAQQALDDTMDSTLQFANDTYDAVGDAFRASENYVRREPMRAVAIAAAVGAAIGFCFAVRAAPIATRRSLPRW